MDSVFGFQGEGYVCLAGDARAINSIFVLKQHHDKIVQVSDRMLLAMVGEAGDTEQLSEFVKVNLRLLELRLGHLSTHMAANWLRTKMAESLRKSPYQVNCLLAGMDAETPALYHLDFYGTLAKLSFGAHGYCGHFLLSLFDKHWHEGMTKEEALPLVELLGGELKGRFLLHQDTFIVKIISTEGVETHEVNIKGHQDVGRPPVAEEPVAEAEAETEMSAQRPALTIQAE
ncbi:proteasome B-type subunit [Kipferlia bialata]|uniref:Proteasome subunit beta n=1 Tax=Kipferlia bialata TaxID=797122 RepID=A0A391NQ24_9EUKA|nr:proteasome B-type subunit [Kipferlia bialata]|eukprot:g3094.t1